MLDRRTLSALNWDSQTKERLVRGLVSEMNSTGRTTGEVRVYSVD